MRHARFSYIGRGFHVPIGVGGDALTPFGVRIYEQHLPPSRILELIDAAQSAS